MLIGGPNPLVLDIINALGLKNVVNLDISIHLDSIMKITVDYYPESEDLQKLIPILTHAKFELVPIVDIKEITTLGNEYRDFTKEQ
jgi:hypothetical protein